VMVCRRSLERITIRRRWLRLRRRVPRYRVAARARLDPRDIAQSTDMPASVVFSGTGESRR
jgi:hypothetical protein